MVFKNLYVIALWMKEALALEGLNVIALWMKEALALEGLKHGDVLPVLPGNSLQSC